MIGLDYIDKVPLNIFNFNGNKLMKLTIVNFSKIKSQS